MCQLISVTMQQEKVAQIEMTAKHYEYKYKTWWNLEHLAKQLRGPYGDPKTLQPNAKP